MVSNVGSFAQNEWMRSRLAETQKELNRLQTQVSSGKKSEVYSGLRDDARLSISLRQTRSTTETFVQSNVITRTRMEQTQLVYDRIKDIASDVRVGTFSAISSASVSAQQGNAALRAQASAALQEVLQLLNTQIDGFHLFAGRRSDARPMVDPGSLSVPGTPLANVADAAGVSPLANASATGDTVYDNIVQHLDGAAVGAVPGASPVRYYAGEYDASAEALITARIDTSADITYGITGRDDAINTIVQALYALSVSELTPATDAGFRRLAGRAADDLKTGFDGLIEEIGELGVKQNQLRELTKRQEDFIVTLDIQLGSVEDVDMATAISRLTFTQTSLQASYQMVAAMRDLSLTRYL
jgi:flagellar hook-associated protein 3 FlgL